MNATNIEENMKVRAHAIVVGFVQGVLFRAETKRIADVYGVTGWIHNLPDGRIEVVLEGEDKYVKIVLEFCRRGPRAARVDNMDVSWERYSGIFSDFQIRYG